MRTLLVTGASGFVGRHLLARAHLDYDVTATGRGEKPDWLPDAVRWVSIDLRNPIDAKAFAKDWWAIVHLAAETLPAAFSNLQPVLDSLAMLLNLLSHLESGRLLFVSSCHVYAPGSDTKTEDSPTRPDGRYGLSKLLCETAALASPKLDVRIARPFNHLGTGMRRELVVPSIVARILAADDGAAIRMLGLNSVRDFLDVTDIVNAYLEILELDDCPNIVFNVCSGQPVSIGALVERLAAAAGRRNSVEFAQAAMSGDDMPRLVGDATRLRTATRWRPSVTLEESAHRIMADR